jgi:hypothetical protein
LQFCDTGGCTYRTELADSNGDWATDFSLPGDQPWEQTTFDLLYGSNGNARQWDDDIDSTMIQWAVRYQISLPLVLR